MPVLVPVLALAPAGCQEFEIPEQSSLADPGDFKGNYLAISGAELSALVPAHIDTEEARAFERTLTDLTAAIPDGGNLQAWAKDANNESPFDLVGVLDPGRTNPDGTQVRGEQWQKIHPATCELLKKARQDLDGLKLKQIHPRVRPHHPDKNESYPSGHTYRAALQAAVLSQVAPARARDLVREAMSLGMLRAVLKVHYPTDIWDGFVVGMTVGYRMGSNPKFQADVEAAKAEWTIAPAASAPAAPSPATVPAAAPPKAPASR